MAEYSAFTFDKSSGNRLMNLPSGVRSRFGGLVAASWHAEYYDVLNRTDRNRAVKFAQFLGKLEDGDSDENIQFMERQTAALATGDVVSLVMVHESGQTSLEAFARGRVYRSRNLIKRILKRPYVYLPDALGSESRALGTAIAATAEKLMPHKNAKIVVDAFPHDNTNQDMLRSLGFQAARPQIWQNPVPFVEYVGEEQPVQQFEILQGGLRRGVTT